MFRILEKKIVRSYFSYNIIKKSTTKWKNSSYWRMGTPKSEEIIFVKEMPINYFCIKNVH